MAQTSGTASSWQQSHTSSRCTSPTSPCVRDIASAAHTSTLTQAGKQQSFTRSALYSRRKRSKCLLYRKWSFSRHELVLTHSPLQSKYAAICITTGNEVAAHTQAAVCLFWATSPSILTHSRSLSSSDAFESPSSSPARPPATFFPF